MSALAEVSRRRDAASVLGLGPRSAELATANLSLETAPCAPAYQLFTGVLYEAAGLESIAEDAAGRGALADHCVILSGLWGAICPTDTVPDHRLSMGTSLPGPGRMSSFWKPHLAPTLKDMAAQGLVVDCRSADYAAAWKPSARDGIEVMTVRVVRMADDGTRKVVSHMAKQARGLLTGELLRTAAEQSLPQEVHADDVAALAARLNSVDDVELSAPDRMGRRVLTLMTR
ncbi:peroxide stress protein YaaA [Actinomyces sp. ZJ308]|uniref:YaaA family protein n=1 Tax=Actinomyces sp. ZJ308 TaxID=2708342 RepID=UPI00142229FA|nr:peroxide stress protein YaaA [Actinomyces sp. ZJ308]